MNDPHPSRFAAGARPRWACWIILFLFPFLASSLAAETFGLFTYDVQNDEVIITDYPEDAIGEVEIPAKIEDLPVTSIGWRAFEDCSGLTRVTIPEGVTSIGWRAFLNCSGLTSVTIPGGVTSIENSAFSGCRRLNKVTLPEGVTSIEDFTFSSCTSLTSVTIPEGVTSIGDWAFRSCVSLTNVTIPGSVTTIRHHAFGNCHSLKWVLFEGTGSAPLVESGAFSVTPRFTIYDLSARNRFNTTRWQDKTSFKIDALETTDGFTYVTIGDEATIIDSFQDVTGELTIPTEINGLAVTSLGKWAFRGSTRLTKVTIPGSTTKIEDGAFKNCTGLTSVTIQEGVTRLGDEAFAGCRGLTSMTIPGSLTKIEAGTFENCAGLTSRKLQPSNLFLVVSTGVGGLLG